MYQADIDLKNAGAGVVILISDKISSRRNKITSDEEGHFQSSQFIQRT